MEELVLKKTNKTICAALLLINACSLYFTTALVLKISIFQMKQYFEAKLNVILKISTPHEILLNDYALFLLGLVIMTNFRAIVFVFKLLKKKRGAPLVDLKRSSFHMDNVVFILYIFTGAITCIFVLSFLTVSFVNFVFVGDANSYVDTINAIHYSMSNFTGLDENGKELLTPIVKLLEIESIKSSLILALLSFYLLRKNRYVILVEETMKILCFFVYQDKQSKALVKYNNRSAQRIKHI